MKKIKFILADQSFLEWSLPPYAAKKNIPEWYKNTSQFSDEKKYAYTSGSQTNKTIKKCIPLMDAITCGYYIPLSSDIAIHENESDFKITWGTKNQIVETHSPNQKGEYKIPDGYEQTIFKFNNNYKIQTPRGYSTLFINPMMQDDQPFYTFPGIVDTDSYPLPVNFPFIIKSNFTGIIDRGTPIIQAIPFKRESWSSEIENTLMKNFFQLNELRSSYMSGFYRNKIWSRKSWK